jgi:hypothetical protein
MAMALFAACQAFNGVFKVLFPISVQPRKLTLRGCEQFRSLLNERRTERPRRPLEFYVSVKDSQGRIAGNGTSPKRARNQRLSTNSHSAYRPTKGVWREYREGEHSLLMHNPDATRAGRARVQRDLKASKGLTSWPVKQHHGSPGGAGTNIDAGFSTLWPPPACSLQRSPPASCSLP